LAGLVAAGLHWSGNGCSGGPWVAAAEELSQTRVAIDEEHQLLDAIWQYVERHALDRTFHGQDWDAVRERIRNVSLPDRAATYREAKLLMKSLGDRYSRFVEPKKFELFSKYDVTGVGMLLIPDEQGRLIVASPPVKNTPANQASIKQGDLLVAIDGEPVEGSTPFEAAERMQGEEGSEVVLSLISDGQPREVKLKRRFAVRDPVEYSMRNIGERRVGYIRLHEFNARCNSSVQHAIEELSADHQLQGYILDLRGNPGGVLEGALEIAGLFQPPGSMVVRVTDGTGREESFHARVALRDKAVARPGVPLVVLVDQLTASSSEVLVGSLRDNCQAVTVGKQTFGKGVIQGVFGLNDGSGIVLTVAKYLTPDFSAIEGKGIAPDVTLTWPNGIFPYSMDGVDFDRAENLLRLCRESHHYE